MSGSHFSWVIAHYSSLVGAVPDCGSTWRFCDADIDRSHLMQLSSRDLIRRVDHSNDGTEWRTTDLLADDLRRAAAKRGDDPESALLPNPERVDGANDEDTRKAEA